MAARLAGGTALAMLGLAGLAGAAAAEPLKVGIIEPMSGPDAATGELYVTAARYGLEEINRAGGFNGEPIEILLYDNGGTAAGTVDKFKQAVADGVRVIFQGSSSAAAGQLTADVRKHNLRNPDSRLLYINDGGAALDLTGDKCHFYHFRFQAPAPMLVGPLVEAMSEAGELGTKVYSINQNYSWGRDMETAIRERAGDGGYEVVEATLHDVAKIQDFAPYVARIKAAEPDTVLTGNWSNDLLLLMKATGEAGLDVRFGTAFLDQPGNIANAGETALGHYLASTYNLAAGDEAFPEDYKARTGHYPVYLEPRVVIAARAFGKALEAVDFGGGAIDVTPIALALEGVTLETAMGPVTIRKEDHQAVMPIVVSRVEKGAPYPVDGTDMGFAPVRTIPGPEAVYPVQESCEMQRPG
ncbi:branched-chain amino acid ABC transporter substrate-binding protein [Marinimicrococcus flavescens]|uniref:Branched-chain amino acid ABC transporter substrate-binding protein n=1 Tax=Marinimicrococcus flavescens TaxID=3031815 RepID=A0AAP3XPN8_9PROT|nr:branched-chain amino acid ABC transporter substrate-binding protein [Marinimicrococcus flavescens]